MEKKNIILSVLVPTILHGIYDFCLFSSIDILLIVFLLFVIAVYIFSIKKIKLLAAQCKKQPQAQPEQQLPQPNNQQYFQATTNNQQGYINQQAQYNASGYITNPNYAPLPQTSTYCSNCGSPMNGNFCVNCGSKQN